MALFGASITLVALAVDPFTQNIVAAHSCQTRSTNQTALAPIADAYSMSVLGVNHPCDRLNPIQYLCPCLTSGDRKSRDFSFAMRST